METNIVLEVSVPQTVSQHPDALKVIYPEAHPLNTCETEILLHFKGPQMLSA